VPKTANEMVSQRTRATGKNRFWDHQTALGVPFRLKNIRTPREGNHGTGRKVDLFFLKRGGGGGFSTSSLKKELPVEKDRVTTAKNVDWIWSKGSSKNSRGKSSDSGGCLGKCGNPREGLIKNLIASARLSEEDPRAALFGTGKRKIPAVGLAAGYEGRGPRSPSNAAEVGENAGPIAARTSHIKKNIGASSESADDMTEKG